MYGCPDVSITDSSTVHHWISTWSEAARGQTSFEPYILGMCFVNARRDYCKHESSPLDLSRPRGLVDSLLNVLLAILAVVVPTSDKCTLQLHCKGHRPQTGQIPPLAMSNLRFAHHRSCVFTQVLILSSPLTLRSREDKRNSERYSERLER